MARRLAMGGLAIVGALTVGVVAYDLALVSVFLLRRKLERGL
jgi:hypothetical protein